MEAEDDPSRPKETSNDPRYVVANASRLLTAIDVRQPSTMDVPTMNIEQEHSMEDSLLFQQDQTASFLFVLLVCFGYVVFVYSPCIRGKHVYSISLYVRVCSEMTFLAAGGGSDGRVTS